MSLDSMKEIFDRMEQEGKPFWEIVLETDMEERQVTRSQSMAKMLLTWQAMADAAENYTGGRRSVSGLVGGDGMKMRQYCFRGEAMSGGYISEVITEALSMAESNACMCRIVAAPTAGACGVMPAVLLPLCKYEKLTQHQILEALYVASGIGAVIAHRACIAGASGGCQAEIGTASAMAAGALVAHRRADRSRGGYGAEEPDGSDLRPRGGSGGGSLREAQCHRRRQCRQRGRYGHGGHHQPHPRGRGHRRHGRGGSPSACGVPRNGAGRSGRHPHRQCHQAEYAAGKGRGRPMMLEFDKLDVQVVPHFKGGQGEAHVRTAVQDDMGRILLLTLPAGSSIGLHTHQGNCEIIHVLSGCGVCHDDGTDMAISAGMTHYCPEGHTHGIDNTGADELVLLGILPDAK